MTIEPWPKPPVWEWKTIRYYQRRGLVGKSLKKPYGKHPPLSTIRRLGPAWTYSNGPVVGFSLDEIEGC